MVSFEAENIFDVIKPLHFCSKIVGLTSFSIKRDGRFRYKSFVSLRDVFCSFAVILWNVFTLYRLLASKSIWILNPTYLTSFFEKCLVIAICSDVCLMIIINVWLFVIRGKVVQVLDDIRDVDESLMEMNVHIEHSLHKKIVFLLVIITKLANVTGATCAYINSKFTEVYNTNLLMSVADFIGTDYCIVFCLQCLLFLMGIKLRYRKINQVLKRLHSRKAFNTNQNNCQRLANLHDKLVEITDSLSFCYGVPVSLKSQ